ncbi:hypothetical protein MO867_20910 [Microbulbifer sp. OS29]|uniref:Uncharacterized protein n=1 Tax=Microbulbifer okhotskensis TaxID=2926617 RepID=A0A9X2ES44_9GAMM|nr:hypothetical protein [Microbulbifer okhotskensis]MCO1336791.1 hypothetical protein [Microbulbifer okhotskensis]
MLLNPVNFLEPISSWVSEQENIDDDTTWIITRVGHFIGELFIEKNGGCWSVCEFPGSRYYGHYAIGDIPSFSNPHVLFAPIDAAFELANQYEGRSLSAIASEIEVTLSGL